MSTVLVPLLERNITKLVSTALWAKLEKKWFWFWLSSSTYLLRCQLGFKNSLQHWILPWATISNDSSHQFQIHISISAEVILAFLRKKSHFGFVNLKGLKTTWLSLSIKWLMATWQLLNYKRKWYHCKLSRVTKLN